MDAPPLDVTTAAGVECFNKGETTIENSQVGTLAAKYAPGALRAAGMGQLIKDLKLVFSWSWRDFENPVLGDEFGNTYQLEVEADCTFLAASAMRKSVDALRKSVKDVFPSCEPAGDHVGCQSGTFEPLSLCPARVKNKI